MMAESSSSPPHQFNNGFSRKSHLGRSDSLVSLARAPFSVQLHRLTSLSLPSPESLHTRILDAESPSESLTRLRNIATDVQKWINTASTVLGQLDADDDVEWAARGKDSLAKVENAAKRFGEIVEMFLDAATVLSARSDERVKEEIKELISIMDDVTHGWSGVRELIRGLREQVALSTEWMEIREILDDISSELDACANMVFELEELRHLSLAANQASSVSNSTASSPTSPMELDRLSNILEQHTMATSSSAPHQTALLRLSARIQPLRASLDFLKPRLSSFSARAEKTFPTALGEVLQRKNDLEKRWIKIESDWRGIGRELQEDEWVEVFRNVGKQATDMMDSINRSMMSVSAYLPDAAPPFDLIEHYIAKKTYYPAAIHRVLGVLDRGYKHRVTFNGEIGRNYDDLRDRWDEIQRQVRKMDETLTELGVHDGVANLSRQVKGLSIVTEQRPTSSGSTTSTTTLTQGPISPAASRTSSIRSGSRVTSLPPQRRESLMTTPTPRNRSVSTTTSSTSQRSSRLFAPFFTPRAKSPMAQRPSTAHGTGTMGLIPLEARPRWNASPIANVLGSPPPKVPSVVITPSRIPRSGRATPTATTISPNRGPATQPVTPKSVSPNKRLSMSPAKRLPMAVGRGIPQPATRLNRMVSNPSLPKAVEEERQMPVPPVPKIPDTRRQTQQFSSPSPLKGRRVSGIPRPSTAQGMNSSITAGQIQPKWRG